MMSMSKRLNGMGWAPERASHVINLLIIFQQEFRNRFNPRISASTPYRATVHSLLTYPPYHHNYPITMAKSLRSKVKQAAGRKRRSDSHYAVAEAARIQRLSDKLMEKSKAEQASKEAAEAGTEAEIEGDDAKMADGESHSSHSNHLLPGAEMRIREEQR